MRPRRLIPLILLLVVIIGLVWVIRARRGAAAAAANPIVLCPGPDAYGYTCTSGAGYAYIDATHDTFLYRDDGVITLELPFPFTFYGTTYTEVNASSNGNLQFATRNTAYQNSCLSLPIPAAAEGEEPTPGQVVAYMGDMIAPYWMDLDLTFYGYLETEVVGEAPNRIFVIEWDNIPPYQGRPEDGVTFAVQLFEGSNDIVFLYQDVTSVRSNGRVAAVLLQSERQGLGIQYSCNQPAIADLSAIQFPHPLDPANDWGIPPDGTTARGNSGPLLLKPDAAALLDALNRSQNPQARLIELRHQWASQNPPRLGQWLWHDLTGDGRDDLILLWRSKPQLEHSYLLVLTRDAAGQFTLAYDVTLSSRAVQYEQLVLVTAADVTGDGQADLLFHDEGTGQTLVLLLGSDGGEVHPLAEKCVGRVGVVAGRIARDGCGRNRLITTWDGQQFNTMAP
ncbi:MAG: VCBS repeat-containing protein [Anaerolineae bacterium]|nr:VCBS repeat-containing protein [Anaerolineae bacterium]